MTNPILDRARFLRDKLESTFEPDNKPYIDELWSLKNDVDSTRAYEFYGGDRENFSDFLAVKIAKALEKSKKATSLSLEYGAVSDRGMSRIMKALEKTEAPISKLEICNFPKVTDKSLGCLPDIIEAKGISVCDVSFVGISQDLRDKIKNACLKNAEKSKEAGTVHDKVGIVNKVIGKDVTD